MSDKSIPVDTGHIEGGNAVEQRYCGALLVNESINAPFARRMEVF
jgi:hypothetical protein